MTVLAAGTTTKVVLAASKFKRLGKQEKFKHTELDSQSHLKYMHKGEKLKHFGNFNGDEAFSNSMYHDSLILRRYVRRVYHLLRL